MVVTYYIKLFRTGTDEYNGILMSLLLLVAETIGFSKFPHLHLSFFLAMKNWAIANKNQAKTPHEIYLSKCPFNRFCYFNEKH